MKQITFVTIAYLLAATAVVTALMPIGYDDAMAKKKHHLTDTQKEDSTASDSNGRACDFGPSHDECPGTPGHSVSTSGDDTSGMPALPHGQHYGQCEEVGDNNELGCDIENN
ncbi:MAG: hypothetical protein WA395_10875 [Nitrososphaeraceae archaeon]